MRADSQEARTMTGKDRNRARAADLVDLCRRDGGEHGERGSLVPCGYEALVDTVAGQLDIVDELEARLALAESALWTVVRGVARGWRIEDRIRVYREVANGLGGEYQTSPGSLMGQFVGLRAER
jgi:hypothetical protein